MINRKNCFYKNRGNIELIHKSEIYKTIGEVRGGRSYLYMTVFLWLSFCDFNFLWKLNKLSIESFFKSIEFTQRKKVSSYSLLRDHRYLKSPVFSSQYLLGWLRESQRQLLPERTSHVHRSVRSFINTKVKQSGFLNSKQKRKERVFFPTNADPWVPSGWRRSVSRRCLYPYRQVSVTVTHLPICTFPVHYFNVSRVCFET